MNRDVSDLTTIAPTRSREPHSDWYIGYLDAKLRSIGPNLTITGRMEIERAFTFYRILCHVAGKLTSTEVLPTMFELQESALAECFRHGQVDNNLVQILFIAIGLLTMLYEPEFDSSQDCLRIRQPTSASGLAVATEIITKFTCPLTDASELQVQDLFNSFGRLIPCSGTNELASAAASVNFTEQIVVSYVNFAALSKVAQISVVFVDCLSLHLEFDEKTKVLKIFRFASYCRLLCSRNSSQSPNGDASRTSHLSR